MENTSDQKPAVNAPDEVAGSAADSASAPERSFSEPGSQGRKGGVFEVCSKDLPFDTAVHPAMAKEDPIVTINDFKLWYGTQAGAVGHQHDGAQGQGHRAHRSVRLR